MRKSVRRLCLIAIFGWGGASVPSAYANGDLASSLKECRAITDDADRLACFDISTSALDAATSINSTVAAAPLTQEDMFGRDDLQDVQKEKKETAKANKSLTSKVVEIAENKRGKYVVILENGQIWRQLTADTNKLRVPKNATGLGVTIKTKALGAHVLLLETGKRSIRVERIK